MLRIDNVTSLVSSGQVSEADLLIAMDEFDYSATTALNQSGHLHQTLGTSGLEKHLGVLRFFNREKAGIFTNILIENHRRGESLHSSVGSEVSPDFPSDLMISLCVTLDFAYTSVSWAA